MILTVVAMVLVSFTWVAVRAGREFALPFGSLFMLYRRVAKSISVKQKRNPIGRPATGITPLVAFRPPAELVAAIDGWATANEVTRSEAMRRLIEAGLKATARVGRAKG